MKHFFLAAKDPGEIPRQTNTSLFTNHVTQGLFIGVCLIGVVFVILVFLQNLRDWKDRKNKNSLLFEGKEEELRKAADKPVNHDFFSSSMISLILLALLSFLIVNTGVSLFFVK